MKKNGLKEFRKLKKKQERLKKQLAAKEIKERKLEKKRKQLAAKDEERKLREKKKNLPP